MPALLASFGAFGLLAQVFLLRELSLVFLGHELSLSLALSAWLFWTGLGSFSGRKRALDPGMLIGLLCLAVPAAMLLARLSKLLTPAGSLPGLFQSMALPILILALPCWLSGAVFAALAKAYDPRKAYFLECAGALSGGCAAAFLLAGNVPGLLCVCAGALALCALAAALLRSSFAAACALLCLGLSLGAGRLDAASRALQFRGQGLSAQKETRYGHLALTRAGETRLFLRDGMLCAQFPDAASREEAHWPLLAHPRPESVLALGAESLPALPELLKHPLRRLDVVETDGQAAAFLDPFLDKGTRAALQDPRTRLLEADPRQWVREHPGSYEVILHLSGEPLNAAANRLFTRNFFEQARRSLKSGGLLALAVPSSENYLSPETAYANASVFRALRAAFPHVSLIPGGRMTLLASDTPFSLEPDALASSYLKRRLRTESITPPAFPYLLMPERRDAVLARLERTPAPLNDDLRPAAYFRTWRVWLSKFLSPSHFLGACGAIFLCLWGLLRTWRLRATLLAEPARLRLFALGFSGMGLEIVLLLSFQLACGALHWMLGLLLASFMAGLAAGSGLFAGRLHPATRLRALPMLCGILILSVAGLLPRLIALEQGSALALFPALLFADGLLLGLAFPLACGNEPAAAAERPSQAAAAPSASGLEPCAAYAADLWGGAAGGFLVSAFFVPLFGLSASLFLCALLLLPAALLGRDTNAI